MCRLRFFMFIVAGLIVGLLGPGAIAQEPKDREVRKIPANVVERVQLYFDLRKKEDWASLFQIDDWEIRNKEDYISIHRNEKSNPYRKFNAITDVYLGDTMYYFQSSGKWDIDGCLRILDRENHELLIEGSVYVSDNVDRGWIVGGPAMSWSGKGFQECAIPLSRLPLKIKAAK
jgi:hypothetical protein